MKNTNSNKYIVGVSGGCDSMALLHMLVQQDKQLIVAHINYNQRPTAKRDQDLVKSFCQNNSIIFELLSVEKNNTNNFQTWARQIRYEFFKELKERYQAEAVFLGHHLDDLLATYLIQKQRKQTPLYWGLKENTEIDGLKVQRPLLKLTKKEIIKYCLDNNVNFYNDESNLSNRYLRNNIRQTVIDQMSDREKQDLLNKINKENKQLTNFYHQVNQALTKSFEPFDIDEYTKYSADIRFEMLRKWLLNQGVDSKRFSLKHLKELDSLLIKQDNLKYKLQDNTYLLINYQQVTIQKLEETGFKYSLKEKQYLTTPYFTVSNSGEDKAGITVKADEYPLCIRNYQKGDKIKLKYGTKKISRWFIDNKIPPQQRLSWPIVLNNKGKIIFVVGIGCDIEHFSNNHNLFVVK